MIKVGAKYSGNLKETSSSSTTTTVASTTNSQTVRTQLVNLYCPAEITPNTICSWTYSSQPLYQWNAAPLSQNTTFTVLGVDMGVTRRPASYIYGREG